MKKLVEEGWGNNGHMFEIDHQTYAAVFTDQKLADDRSD